MEKKRLDYIDVARGLGMICIILGHLGNDQINRVVYTFHVPIFFLISGFFISNKQDIKTFCKKRAKSLLVPYVAAAAVLIVLGAIESMFIGISWYGADTWFASMTSGAGSWGLAALYGAGTTTEVTFGNRAIGAIWFLWAIFWGSLLLRISLSFNKWVRPFFAAALFAAAVISKNYIWLPFSLQPGMCALLYMYIGWLIWQVKDVVSKVPLWPKILAAAAAVLFWISFIIDFDSFWFVRCDFGRGVLDIFRSLCACGAVIGISWALDRWCAFAARGLAAVGRYSMLILCIHNLELNLIPWNSVTGSFVAWGMPSWLQLPLIIAGKLALDFFAAWVLIHIRGIRKIFGYEKITAK